MEAHETSSCECSWLKSEILKYYTKVCSWSECIISIIDQCCNLFQKFHLHLKFSWTQNTHTNTHITRPIRKCLLVTYRLWRTPLKTHGFRRFKHVLINHYYFIYSPEHFWGFWSHVSSYYTIIFNKFYPWIYGPSSETTAREVDRKPVSRRRTPHGADEGCSRLASEQRTLLIILTRRLAATRFRRKMS